MDKKLLLVVLLVAVVGGGGAYYWLQVRGADDLAITETVAPINARAAGAADCAPPATGATTDPAAGATTDPAAGATTDPNATPGATDPAASQTVDPNAPVVAGQHDGSIVVADGASLEGYSSDSPIYAEAAVDPNAVTPAAVPTDPTATAGTTDPAATAGTTDPGATAGANPTAGAAPATTTADPAAGTAVDPCDNGSDVTNPSTSGAAGTKPTSAGTDTGTKGTRGPIDTRQVGEDANTGNTSEALTLSIAVAGIADKNQLKFEVASALLPAAAGLKAKNPKGVSAYRKKVTAVVLRIKIADEASMRQWATSKRATRVKTVTSFLKLAQKLYPGAQRSVSIVSTDDRLLAIGDQAARGKPAVTALEP